MNSSEVKKMFIMEKLARLLQTHNFKNVLDLGCGKGQQSLLCASYGCEVDAVDTNTRDDFKFELSLVGHPHIKQYIMKIEDFNFTKKYDLIIFLNVIMFMDKEFTLETYLPSLKHHIEPNGILFLAFLLENGDLEKKAVNQIWYKVKEIKDALSNLRLIESYNISKEQDSPKHGRTTFTSHIMIFQNIL